MKYIKNKITNTIAYMGDGDLVSMVVDYEELDGTKYTASDWEVLEASESQIFALLEQQTEANISYGEKRRREYASLEEQADMKYWDEMNGTTTWKDHISDIKAKYPKS